MLRDVMYHDALKQHEILSPAVRYDTVGEKALNDSLWCDWWCGFDMFNVSSLLNVLLN